MIRGNPSRLPARPVLPVFRTPNRSNRRNRRGWFSSPRSTRRSSIRRG